MVTVYSTPTCGFCKMAKQYLKSNNIEFTAKDITTDAEAFQEIADKSNQRGVPVLDIDGSIIVGFNRPAIDSVLRDKGLM